MIDFSQQSLWGNWFLHMIRKPPQSTFPGWPRALVEIMELVTSRVFVHVRKKRRTGQD